MGFNPFKKKSLWDEVTNAVGSVADKVLPGNQSSWHDQGQQQTAAPVREAPAPTDFGVQQQSPLSVISQPAQPKLDLFANPQQSKLTVAQPTITQQPLQVEDSGPTITAPTPHQNLFQRGATDIGHFGKAVAKDVKDTTVGAYQGVNTTIKGIGATNALSDNTDKQAVNTHAWNQYMATLQPQDYQRPDVQAKLAQFRDTSHSYNNAAQTITSSADTKDFQNLDAKKFAFQAGETALNVGTLGVGTLIKAPAEVAGKVVIKSALKDIARIGGTDALEQIIRVSGNNAAKEAGKEVIKAATKGTVKKIAQTAGKDSLIGGTYGAVQTGKNSNENTNAGDYFTNIALGATIGGGIPVAGAAIRKIPGVDKAIKIVGGKISDVKNELITGTKNTINDSRTVRQINRDLAANGSDTRATRAGVARARQANAQNELDNTVNDVTVPQLSNAGVSEELAQNADNNLTINNPTNAATDGNGLKPGENSGVMEKPIDTVVSVTRADGRIEQYKPQTPEELAVYQKHIDDNRIANGDMTNGIAGQKDQYGDTWHISSGSQVKSNYTPITEAPFLADKPVVTPAIPETPVFTPAKTNANPNNMDLGTDPRARFANRSQVDPATEIANKYGGDTVSVQRNIDRYGESATQNMYARKSDALPYNPDTGEGIKNLDAVVTSELKKSTPPTVRITNNEATQAAPEAPVMSPEELASLDNYAPNGPAVPTVKPAELTTPTELVKPQELVNPTTPAEVPLAQPTNDTANLLPEVKVTDSPLGTMAQDFYDGKAGNQQIKFRDIKQLGTNITTQLEEDFKAIGSDFRTVARETQEAKANGIALEDIGLTPEETNLWLKAQQEVDYIRRRASLGGREVGIADLGDLYFPHQRTGEYQDSSSLFDGFRDNKPGNEFSRKSVDAGGIPLDELDYSPSVIGQYVTRYADTKLLNEDRIGRAVQKANPTASEQAVSEATTKIIAVQDKLNNARNKITVGGFGKRVLVTDGEKFDVPAEMAQVGRDLGHTQTDVVGTPHGLTNGDRINSVIVDGKPLGDVLGLNQHRDAASYAGSQVAVAKGDRQALASAVSDRLARDYNLPIEDINRLTDRIGQISATVPDDVVTAIVSGTYTTAAKQQIMEQLQNHNITNPGLRSAVSDLTTQILREGSVEQKLSAKVIKAALTTQNAIFRKFNVSSAINELSDLASFVHVYGKDLAAIPDFSTLKTYGLGESDPAIEPFLKQVADGGSVSDVMSKINNATNLYHFVETYKAGVVATSARNKYTAAGLTGDDLTKAILNDYRKLTLPVDAFTKTFLDNYPLYTQYLTWGARNLQKEGKLAAGTLEVGNLTDMTQKQRIARNLYANLPAKTVFWLASNGLKGTAITSAFGLTDFTGLTNQDYSGIAEEDKSNFDRTTQVTNSSTTLSLLNSIYQGYEKEQLKTGKYKDANYNPYDNNNFANDMVNSRTPQIIKNVAGPIGSDTNHGAIGLMKDGYSQNKDKRVQYEAPTDAYNIGKAFVFGKGQTDNAREYSGAQNVVERVKNGKNPVSAIKDMALEQTGVNQPDFNRPLNDKYSEAYKAKTKDARTALLQGGRQYNDYLDNFKKTDPTNYDLYVKGLDGNHVSPEYWKAISTNANGGTDMKTFDMISQRKKQLAKDLGTPYDPTYDLSGEQAKSVAQLKSTATGDDLALRNVLNKEGWYKDYKKQVSAYYDKTPDTASGDFKETARVKDWNGLSDKLSTYYYDKTATAQPEWAKTYPLVYEQKAVNDKYGFDSQESKDFFKANADGYQTQKDGYDKEQLVIINQMRKIEGHPEMGWEAYKQATNVANTSDKTKSGSGDSNIKSITGHASFGSAMALDLPSASIKTAKVIIKSREQSKKTIKVKRGGKI